MVKINKTANNSAYLTEKIEKYLQTLLNNNHFIGSVLVARDGEVLLSRGYGMANLEHSIPNTSKTKFRIASLTKQFTATAILKLQEQNLLDVNNSLATYLPDYPKGEQITVHQLLNHTAGIPSFTSFEDFPAKKRMAMELDELIALFKDRPLDFAPGDKFNYSNSGYAVLTKIIEVVSNLAYADYLQQHIFSPLKMNNSGYDRLESIISDRAAGYMFADEEYQNADFIDMSIPVGAGGLYSTVEDLYKWSKSIRTNTLLDRASTNAMFSPTVEIPNEENEQIYYGYGWKIDRQHQKERIFHEGIIDGFSTYFAQYPSEQITDEQITDEQITIVILSNLLQSPVAKIEQDLAAIAFDRADKSS